MRFALPHNSLALVAAFVLGLVASPIAAPLWKSAVIGVSQDGFADLTYKCDHAMREHMIAKQKLNRDPVRENVKNLRAMEIGLLDCQDYDLLRKRLIRWGLSDNEVSEMSLRAVEERADSLKEVIRVHEIRY
jgi:hypothetical protein